MRISKQDSLIYGEKNIDSNTKNALIKILILSLLIPMIFNFHRLLDIIRYLNEPRVGIIYSNITDGYYNPYFIGKITLIYIGLIFCMSLSALAILFLIRRNNFIIRAGLHILCLLAVIVITIMFNAWAYNKSIPKILIGSLIYSIYSYMLILASSLLINSQFAYRESLEQNSFIRRQKTEVEIEALKQQLSPHFFFNTLSSLSAVVRSGNKNHCVLFVKKMTHVYKYIMDKSKKDFVSALDEIEFARSFTYLLERRFENKLIVNFNFDNNLLNNCYILPLSIQTCIENAAKHNVISDFRNLEINIYTNNNEVVITNRKKLKSHPEGLGIGLYNLNKRYELLTGKSVVIEDTSDTFTVHIPTIESNTLRQSQLINHSPSENVKIKSGRKQ